MDFLIRKGCHFLGIIFNLPIVPLSLIRDCHRSIMLTFFCNAQSIFWGPFWEVYRLNGYFHIKRWIP